VFLETGKVESKGAPNIGGYEFDAQLPANGVDAQQLLVGLAIDHHHIKLGVVPTQENNRSSVSIA